MASTMRGFIIHPIYLERIVGCNKMIISNNNITQGSCGNLNVGEKDHFGFYEDNGKIVIKNIE